MHLPQLKRIRWAVRAALFLGMAASVAANVLHARPNIISQIISAWPPLALLITVELTSRIPMHRRGLASLRIVATGVIAGIAAWVSYWHMQDVAYRFGENQMSSYLLPVSVDGLIVVASVSLVELAGRIRSLEGEPDGPVTASSISQVQYAAPAVQSAMHAPAYPMAQVPVAQVPIGQVPVAHVPAQPMRGGDEWDPTSPNLPAAPVSPAYGSLGMREPVRAPLSSTPQAPRPGYVNGSAPRANAVPAVSAPARTMVTASTDLTDAGDDSSPRQRRPLQETAELADAIEALNPDISQTELARQLGISATRLRAVRREARDARRAAAGQSISARS